MRKIDTGIPGVFILEPKVFGDHRGYFMETYSKDTFMQLCVEAQFVQDNQSFTRQKGTLRGIHFQNEPMAQAKLVRVSKGAVLDVAVDLRKGSPTYLHWEAVELSADNKRMLFIPRGFGHGFLTLTDDVEFLYKVDNPYSRECDRCLRFDEPNIGIKWGRDDPILSEKDAKAPSLADSDCNFEFAYENRCAKC